MFACLKKKQRVWLANICCIRICVEMKGNLRIVGAEAKAAGGPNIKRLVLFIILLKTAVLDDGQPPGASWSARSDETNRMKTVCRFG